MKKLELGAFRRVRNGFCNSGSNWELWEAVHSPSHGGLRRSPSSASSQWHCPRPFPWERLSFARAEHAKPRGRSWQTQRGRDSSLETFRAQLHPTGTPLTHALLLQRNTQHKVNNNYSTQTDTQHPHACLAPVTAPWQWLHFIPVTTWRLDTKSMEKLRESSTRTVREQRQDMTEMGKPRLYTSLVFILLHKSVKII